MKDILGENEEDVEMKDEAEGLEVKEEESMEMKGEVKIIRRKKNHKGGEKVGRGNILNV